MGEPARQGEALGESARSRVILVGRTGLEATLRRDASVLLVRVETAVEAVGEATAPPETDPLPLSCVVVAAEADPGGAQSALFAGALRQAEPGARLILVSDRPGAGAGSYDSVVNASMPFHALKAVLMQGAGGRTAEPAGDAVSVPAVEPAVPAASVAAGDEDALLQAVLAGRDVTIAALEQVRRRSGVGDAVFTPGPGDLGGGGVPVSHHGRVMGRLTSATGGEAAAALLRPHATVMAQWLALSHQQKELRRAALSDELTGAYNRRYFERFLRAALEQAARDRHPLMLLMFDIDNFKRFNDEHGHVAGDDILRETVRLLTSVIRPADRVCRIGGDEFAVVFYEPGGPRDPASKPPQDVLSIAKRFQEQVSAQRFPKLGVDAPGMLTISGGLACYPWDGRTAEELIRRADGLSMESKRQGKNAIMFGPGTMKQ